MFRIGCHLSSSKGFLAMAKQAEEIGANTFQFFTRNPRGGKAKDLDVKDIAAYQQYAAEHGIGQILAHAPYTINACGKDERVQEFARETMADDLRRLEEIPDCKYNFHPGSHVQQGAEVGIEKIAGVLNEIMWQEQKTTGNLTMDAIVRIINHPALKKLPFYLETPNDLEGYAREIAMLKAARKD